MMRKNRLKIFLFHLVLSLLILNFLSSYYPLFSTGIREVDASPSVSQEWVYSGWGYRKEHNITWNVTDYSRFYDVSDRWTTIVGNPISRHAFQPVHNTTIQEVNLTIDGAPRKYLAYDSDPGGQEIRLYYTNDLDGEWTSYSGNPILSSAMTEFRWPSVTYVTGTFHMFLTNRLNGTLERWTSTDGINFNFQENVQSGTTGEDTKNPFIWLNPNDNRWYLYWHDSLGLRYIYARNATNIQDLDTASDTIVLSRSINFGAPTIMYYDNRYWLLAEIFEGGAWRVVAYYSTTSPSSGFNECSNSPILNNDEACPVLLLNPNQTRAYLFTNRNDPNWYQDTREVYLNSIIFSKESNLINYQIRITAHYGNGTDSGENIYLNGHSRTDFGDIRFTWFNSSSGSEIECDYWIEELKTGESAVFWVEIPEISGGVNNTIYVYYGKNDATTTSSGDATFDFFDDFSGDLSKWTVVGGTWQVENGILNAETTNFGQRIVANGFSFENHAVHVKIEWISGAYLEHAIGVRGQTPNEQSNGYFTFLSAFPYLNRDRISRMSGGSETTIASTGTTDPSRNVWYNCVFKLYGNTLKSSFSPLYSTEIVGTDSTYSNGTLCLLHWSMYSERSYFDDLFVRKYVDPEPTHGSWGSEEPSDYIIIDQTLVSDERADTDSVQTIGFHARWSNNGSDVDVGSIYVNGTGYVLNSTGWINVNVSSSMVRKEEWVVTGVNCSGTTMYVQTTQTPSIVWDQIKIVDGGVTDESIMSGETVTFWFKSVYEYDNVVFDGAKGILYANGSAMSWSTANNRWEYNYTATILGTKSFSVTGVSDSLYGLSVINDTVGAIDIIVLEQATLTVSLDTSTTKVGYKVEISGKLAFTSGTGISGADLLLTYSVTSGESWNDITSVVTIADGDYYAEWMPTATGNYLVKVSWEGDEALYIGITEVNTTLAVIPADEILVFSVVSNSTISELAFNSTSRVLSFAVSGPSGTTGYTNITIAKTLIEDISELTIYLDGNQINYTAISTDDSWLLHFTYQHSTHKVVVSLGSPHAESFIKTPLGTAPIFSGIAIAILAAILLVRKRLRCVPSRLKIFRQPR